ncbi:MAG TPA: tRNA preQ1(34) S-adenosylmethionine ribosyltransferase-isomerase QueA [Candidatus Acidoferrales bacterium]|nr:tRNA preQ1(34) S-adenosylmethionine ribosyltransferase-isomerase QueA [Candidatus Acidoferrales bacterium]
MLASDYDFALPPELIAQAPAAQRDASRLLVLDGDATADRRFSDLPAYLNAGDVLVLNETRVIAARIFGERAASGGRVEFLLLHPARTARYDPAATQWIALAKPARRLRAGERVVLRDEQRAYGTATVVTELEDGLREIEFALDLGFEEYLERAGRLPLPPYIHNESAEAQQRYQTVFARVPGSVAAPTASLHFTPEVLAAIEARGVEIARLTLDVGLGTFRPIVATRVEEHRMHAESYAIPAAAAGAVERARAEGRRVIAAGTTVVRALEGSIQKHGRIVEGEDATDIFIQPGFAFAAVDAMITNFHLPQSSLLVLVSAFAGRERIMRAYAQAIERRYRFFSFGDAMLILRRAPA